MFRILAVACLIAGGAVRALGATPGDPAQHTARLVVVVNDPSRAVIAGARVSIARQDVLGGPSIPPVTTGVDGTAVFEALPPGRYLLTAEFDGFETVQVKDYRVNTGDNRRALTLPIGKRAEGLTVERDKQDDGLDPGGSAFSTILTREQIDALPDDPEEMAAVLKAMSPPGAEFRVDGFTGGRLPPKSQIRSIRLPRMDQFAAQNHGGMMGAMFIDISTQPGGGVLGGSVETALRDDALNARNPFTPEKGTENLRQGAFSFGGPVVQGRSSFNLDVGGGRQIDSGTILAALPGQRTAAPVDQRMRHTTFGGRFDQAIGSTHTLRMGFRSTEATRTNLGVGAYDLAERAYSTSTRDRTLRVSESGAIGRRLFIESRLEAQWTGTSSRSALEAPTVRVLDSFTAGGAQQRGGRTSVEMEAATDIDYVRGQHSYRAGVLFERGRYDADDQTNYLGTFTFSTLADFEAGRPSLYTRQTGDPRVRYVNTQVGAYAQDDYRIARSLLLSYGVRYEGQSTGGDWWNLTPRATLTWSPLRSGRTTLRAAFGTFRDWLSTGVYEQALRLDGVRQVETIAASPAYPDPGSAVTTRPSNRYTLGGGTSLAGTRSWSLGVDQVLARPLRVSATVAVRTSSSLLRGVNDNAPVAGLRPDPAFRDVIRAVGDAGQRTTMMGVSATLAWPEWRRTFIGVNYTLSSTESNTVGAFALPASGDLAREWGFVSPRHRFGANANLRLTPNLSVAVTARAQAGMPYDITTSVDTNDDGQFTDRPEGTPRNSARTAAHWDVGGRISYAIGFGGAARRGASGGDQVVIRMGPGSGMPGGFDGGAENSRYRLEFYVSAQNLTNHQNFVGYSGVLTSPFFGEPTNVLNPRKVEVGVRWGF